MPQPTPYAPATDFQAELGTAHGAHLNDEFAAIQLTVSETNGNLALLQRDDGRLGNLTVHPDALTAATKLLLGTKWVPRGLWEGDVPYAVGDVVESSGRSYVCAVQHVSSTPFDADHLSGRWVVLYEPLSVAGISASQVAFSPTATVTATNIQEAIAEIAGESTQRSLNFADIPDPDAALRNLGGFPKSGGSLSGAVQHAKSGSMPAAGTVDLAAATGNFVSITGAGTISSLGSVQAGAEYTLEFAGVCTLVHDGTSMKIPGNANITTAAGDVARFISLGSGNWKCVGYIPYAYLVGESYFNGLLTGLLTVAGGINGSQFSHRNKIINGAMMIDQRNVGGAKTFTAAAEIAYCVDRWFGAVTGANVTGQRVVAPGSSLFCYRFTGAAAVTGIIFGQRIESANSIDLAGKAAVLSVNLANSLLATVSWEVYYAGEIDSFGTLAAPTKTMISSGTFAVDSTQTRYSASFSVPPEATTGLEIILSVGAQTSGTWDIGSVQVEAGTVATPFEMRPISSELADCQRYFEKSFSQGVAPAQNAGTGNGEFSFIAGKAGATAASGHVSFKATKRSKPKTITLYNPVATNAQVRDMTASVDCSASTTTSASESGFRITATGNASTAVGNTLAVNWVADAEI